MRTLVLSTLLAASLAGCHAKTVADERKSMASEGPPRSQEVKSSRPVRTTPGGMLDKEAVTKIQRALNDKGHKVAVSGKLDQATEVALKKFQKAQSQPATGFPDYDTLKRLGLDAQDIYLGGTKRLDDKDK
jgi:peptidoglycan hydrolase-like protein with peptidoglycan-binding domain